MEASLGSNPERRGANESPAAPTEALRVLALTHRVPFPPDKGDKIRTHHLLTRLARHAEVHLVCFADPPDDVAHRAHLERSFASVRIVPIDLRVQKLRALPYLATARPLTIPVFDRREMRSAVSDLIRRVSPSVIYAESSSMAPYALEHAEIPLVMDFVDMDSAKWRACAAGARGPLRWVYAREAWTLARYEHHLASRARLSTVTAARELSLFREIAPGADGRVLANGVDTDFFTPRKHLPSKPSIVFFGAMDYVANVEAAVFLVREILPRVRAKIPGTTVALVGSKPTREVIALGEVPGVTVTGFVSDIRPHVQAARVSVCPLRVARGIQNKVLEAMAMGVPVIATPEAAEGIEADVGREIVVAPYSPDGAALADALVAVILDSNRCESLALAARERVVAGYGWEPRANELLAMLEEAAIDPSGSRS